MTTMIVNGHRYLINDTMCDKMQDENTERILKHYPADCIIEFEVPTKEDVLPTKLNFI